MSALGDRMTPGGTDQQLEQQVRLDLMTDTQGQNGLRLGGGSGRGYALSPADLQSAINTWQQILDRARTYDRAIARMTNVVAPAPDDASQTFTLQLRISADILAESNTSLKTYAATYLARLRATQQAYQNTEHGNATTMGGGR